MPQTNQFFAVFRIIKSGKIGKNRKNVKKLTFGKVADFWHFFLMYKVFYDFFKNSFNKLLDFFGKCAHTMRAFKLEMCAYYAGFQVGNSSKTNLNP